MRNEGRGTDINPDHRYQEYKTLRGVFEDSVYEETESIKTEFIPTFPNDIVCTMKYRVK